MKSNKKLSNIYSNLHIGLYTYIIGIRDLASTLLVIMGSDKMFNKLSVKVPNNYKETYIKEIVQSNAKNIIVLGLIILAVQIGTYVYGLFVPFTQDADIMGTYYLFYRLTLIIDISLMAVLVFAYKKYGVEHKFTKVMMVIYLFLIHKWAMASAVFDQFQGEGVTIYFFSMFFIVILVNLTLTQTLMLFGSGYIAFVQLLKVYEPMIGDRSEVIMATGQFILFGIVIGHYIRELRKKNFIQQQSLEVMNKDLEFLSYYDPLSGLHNRRKWENEYYLMYKAAVNDNKLAGIIIIDIDYFKEYNDTYGHVEGDHVIKVVSNVVLSVMDGKHANVGRYGGDEFIISVYDMSNNEIIESIKCIKDSLRLRKIENINSKSSSELTLSIGWRNIIPEIGDQEWDLVAYADSDLYLQKKHRKLRNVN